MQKLLFRVLITAVVGLVALSCRKDRHDVGNTSTYVIVPGAWQASYAWQTVATQLRQSGNNVVIVDLSGHGSDTTPPQNITMDVYRDKVAAAINRLDGKVILVGHSLAGMVISAVAEKIPTKIESLVYIAAYLPATGQSLLDLASTDSGSLLGKSIVPSQDMLTLGLVKANIINIFIQDGSPAVQSLVLNNYRPEPAIPFTNPVVLTAANFGSIPKYYVNTLLDHAVTPALQNRMLATTPVKQMFPINTSHSPFLSKPDSVTAILLTIGQ